MAKRRDVHESSVVTEERTTDQNYCILAEKLKTILEISSQLLASLTLSSSSSSSMVYKLETILEDVRKIQSQLSSSSSVNQQGLINPVVHKLVKMSEDVSQIQSQLSSSSIKHDLADNALPYCALFPPDYEFERDTILQLWMADGIFVEEPIEINAGIFLQDCLAKGYFQFSRTNLVTGKAIYSFKGDDCLVSLSSSSSHVVRIEGSFNLNDIPSEVSHVSMRCNTLVDSTVVGGFRKFEKLRTLLFLQGRELSLKQVPRDLFLSLGVLRALDLSRTHLTELPSSIGNMINLCFLNLSETPIKRLPEAIGNLENLQTLKLRGCSNLSTLRKGMRKLVYLHHLGFDVLGQLHSMPKGIGALKNIQTLSAFLVGGGKRVQHKAVKELG